MSSLDVPKAGLSLCRDNPANGHPVKPAQIMRLNLAQNTLDDLIQSLRDDQPARIRLGKHPTIYYGSNKSHPFHSCPESHRSEVYRSTAGDKKNLYFAGVLSHSLEVQKAKDATAATDQALATLEHSLNAFERGKESKKTHIITDINAVRALRAGDNRSSTGREAARLAGKPSSRVELEKDRLLRTAANRSVSSSPALGVSRTPISLTPLTPTSAPSVQINKNRIRQDALKAPFIHLLAVRAVSSNFIARKTRSSVEDCEALASKYGVANRIDPEKFDLRDKIYKDLDVWSFPYPSQDDRQGAIENAVAAFDRLRISRSDKLWQRLLPKEERGKGKCLSRLDLRDGPKPKPLKPAELGPRIPLPRIQDYHRDESGKDGDSTGPETDQSRGKKSTTQKKPADKAKKNGTLTGRVVKNRDRKAPSYKSAEWVWNSDDDDEDSDVPDASASENSNASPPAKSKSQPKAASKRELYHPPTPKVDPPEPTPTKQESPSQAPSKTATKRLPSSRGPAQKSPQKPSPLGSSPPTNASDIQGRSRSTSQNNSSSSASSPLITQITRPKTNAVSSVRTAKPNGVAKSSPAVNPLKRKAELERPSSTPSQGRTTGDLEHKRRRAISTSSGSTGSASPPLSREIMLQQLREKSRKFKQHYAKYHTLHDSMAAHPDPPRADLEKLQRQHALLQRMKKEIWDEDTRLRHDL
ncbi:hypothetical protein FE257_006332 [Aspergillus nanangensis]|uniref:E3 ubiquitin-protein ligase n=1 Tax=Aspergillus nanangensis TaxID=2582783 RepID=A0AAD4GUX3_ASPNN|nr:hypothetical protein FE257_006332 [Aspergillus nanangensis]